MLTVHVSEPERTGSPRRGRPACGRRQIASTVAGTHATVNPVAAAWVSGTAGSPPTGNAATLGVRTNSRCLFYYYHWWSAHRPAELCCALVPLASYLAGCAGHSLAIVFVLPAHGQCRSLAKPTLQTSATRLLGSTEAVSAQLLPTNY